MECKRGHGGLKILYLPRAFEEVLQKIYGLEGKCVID